MSHTLCRLYYHVVWSTHQRRPMLDASLQAHLRDVITEKCRRMGCRLHGVNAVENHVHLALEIPPTLAVSEVIGQIKGVASRELNRIDPGSGYWQEGFGAFSFRASDLPRILEYIARQQERLADGDPAGLTVDLEQEVHR